MGTNSSRSYSSRTQSASRVNAGKNGPLSPRGKAGLFSLALIGVVGFATFWSPPISRQHEFTTASDYSASRDAGCTNSGEGCHGSETDYADFNDYHPNSDCSTCHEYTGVGCIPCHSPSSRECAECHDGSMEGASDAVRLTDPYPNGHYRETTHTAMGTDMDVVVRTVADGAAGAACKDCHSRDLKTAHTDVPVVPGSPYGETVGCGECHNDVRSNGLAQVLSDWENRGCEDCHAIGSSSPMHSATIADSVESSGTAGCAATGSGCHDIDDLHALHPDAPKSCSGSAVDGEPGCHDLSLESHAPTARSCGGGESGACHQPYANDRFTHENDRSDHSPTGWLPARGTYEGVACGSCHFMDPDGTSLVTEHDLGTSSRTEVPDNGCRNCHNHPASLAAIENEWSVRDTGEACTTCHDGDGLDSAHAGDLSASHRAEDSEGCAGSGAGCHEGDDLSSVGAAPAALHDDCLTCHDRTASGTNLAYDPSKKSCGSGRDCHNLPTYTPGDGVHGDVNGSDAAHLAGPDTLADAASGRDEPCGSCHAMLLGVEHDRAHSSLAGDTCLGCHNDAFAAVVVKASWTSVAGDRSCAACHALGGVHDGKDSMHAGTELDRLSGEPTPASCAKAGCHNTLDLRVLHAARGCDTSGCHTSAGDIRGTRITSCGGPDGTEGACHTSSNRHANDEEKHTGIELHRTTGLPDPGSCAKDGCHSTVNVKTLHVTTRCYNTPGCHMEGGPTFMSCGGPDGTEGACHTSSNRHANDEEKHTGIELHRTTGLPDPGSCAKDGCHATVNLKTLHVTTRCYNTAGCHTVGGPVSQSCGGPDGTGACHTSSLRHSNDATAHAGVEINSSGVPTPGTCVRSGCHATNNLKSLHVTTRCYNTAGCHMAGGPVGNTCGGPDGTESVCHTSSNRHRVSHSADMTGTVNGITYGVGENIGCLGTGCHDASLTTEHRNVTANMEGTAVNLCAVCHEHTDDPGNGTYSTLSAVKAAIASRDKRCVACHQGGATDGPDAVASPPAATCMPVVLTLEHSVIAGPMTPEAIVSVTETVAVLPGFEPSATPAPLPAPAREESGTVAPTNAKVYSDQSVDPESSEEEAQDQIIDDAYVSEGSGAPCSHVDTGMPTVGESSSGITQATCLSCHTVR